MKVFLVMLPPYWMMLHIGLVVSFFGESFGESLGSHILGQFFFEGNNAGHSMNIHPTRLPSWSFLSRNLAVNRKRRCNENHT